MELYHCGNQWGYTPLGNTANIPTDVCQPPTSLKAVATNQHVLFSWVAPHDYKAFLLEYRVGVGAWTPVTVYGTSISIELAGETTYNWRVTTVCSGILSSVPAIPLDPFITTDVAITGCVAVDASTITLTNMGKFYRATWSGTGALYYKVFICVRSQIVANNPPCGFFIEVQTNSIDLPPLTVGQEYVLVIQAFCKDGSETVPSGQFPFTPAPQDCPAPIKLTVIRGETSIYASWFTGMPIGTGLAERPTYNVYLDGNLVATNLPFTNFTFLDLNPGQTYLVEVRQNCKGSFSPSTGISVTTNNTACGCVLQTFTTSNQTATSVRFNWTVNCAGGSTVDHYEITTGFGGTINIPAGTLFYDFLDLPSGFVFKAKIVVVCTGGMLGNQLIQGISLSGCAAVANLLAIKKGAGFYVSWDGTANAIRYKVRVFRAGVLYSTQEVTTNDFYFPAPDEGTAYTFEVSSICYINGVEVTSPPTTTPPITIVEDPCLAYDIKYIRQIDSVTALISFDEQAGKSYTGTARLVVRRPDTTIAFQAVLPGAGDYKFNNLVQGVTYDVSVYDIPYEGYDAETASVVDADRCIPPSEPYPHENCWTPASVTLTFINATTLRVTLPAMAWTAAQTKAAVRFAPVPAPGTNPVWSAPIDVPKANFPYDLTVPGYGLYYVEVTPDCDGQNMPPVVSAPSCPVITNVVHGMNGTTLSGVIQPSLIGYVEYKITVTALKMSTVTILSTTANFEVPNLQPGRIYQVTVEVICTPGNPEVLSPPFVFIVTTSPNAPQQCAPPIWTSTIQDCNLTYPPIIPTPPAPTPTNPSACLMVKQDWQLQSYLIIPVVTVPGTMFIEAVFSIYQFAGIDPEAELIPGGIMGRITSPACMPDGTTTLEMSIISGGSEPMALSATLSVTGNITGSGSYTPNSQPALYVRIRGSYSVLNPIAEV